MIRIDFEYGALSVDAALIAEGLRIDAKLVLPKMREGKITSVCERGVDRDAGRPRLRFFYAKRCFSLIVDAAGNVIESSITGVATS
jgi:hypothetical protein